MKKQKDFALKYEDPELHKPKNQENLLTANWKCRKCGSDKKHTYKELCVKCHHKERYYKNKEKLKQEAKEYYLKNRKRRIETSTNWNKKNRIRKIENSKNWYKKNSKLQATYQKKWLYSNKENLIIAKIRSMTKQRFQREEVCVICGSENSLEFHHWIYKTPIERRDFSTLCKDCHRVQHFKIMEIPNEK